MKKRLVPEHLGVRLGLRYLKFPTVCSARAVRSFVFASVCLQFTLLMPCPAQSARSENEASEVEALQIQGDGKILVGGTHVRDSRDWLALTGRSFALMRFLKDGAVDTTFGKGGKVSTLIGRGSKLTAIALQPDGKIVAAGFSDNGKAHVVAVVRYNPNGDIDTTFGVEGKVTTAARGNYGRAFRVFIQPDGKIIAAGHSNTTPRGFDIFIVRYNPDGTIDKTFGRQGVVNTSIGVQNNGGQAAFLQKDGKIVAVGQAAAAGKLSMVAARYTPAGLLDTTFASQGKATISAGKGSSASTVVPIGDTSMLVAGYSAGASSSDKIGEILQLDQSGHLDRSFAHTGRLSVPKADITVLKIDGDSIIAAGDLGMNEDDACRAYIRISTSGSVMSSANIKNDDILCKVNDLAIQADGRVLIAGSAESHFSPRLALYRFNRDGTLDSLFGSNGIVISDF